MLELEALLSRPFYGPFSHSKSKVTSREASNAIPQIQQARLSFRHRHNSLFLDSRLIVPSRKRKSKTTARISENHPMLQLMYAKVEFVQFIWLVKALSSCLHSFD